MPTYEITGKNGGIYELEAADDSAAKELESYINQRIDAGDPDITKPPPNTQVLPWEKSGSSPESVPVMGGAFTKAVDAVGNFGQSVSNEFGKGIDNLARAGEWAVDKVGLGEEYRGLSESLGMAPSVDEAAQNRGPDKYAGDNDFGQFIGGAIGTLPTAYLGVLGGGAASGALLTNARDAGGVATDAGIGAVSSLVGDRLIRGAAGLARPALGQNLQTLVDAGVSVTPGQALRSSESRVANALAGVEDKATSTAFTGDMIAGRRRRGFEQFGRATVNRALEPIGETLPDGQTGRRAVAYAGDRLGQAYDAVLPRLSATGDQQFVDDLAGIHQEASSMLPARVDQFNNILDGLGRFWEQGVRLDGRALKDIETRIGERVRRAAMSTDADQRELGDRLGDVLASVRDLAARQNPAEAETLSSINRGWKSLTQVERAAGNSRGDITPAGYSQSVKQSSDTARRRGYARGEALNQDLADAASEILPSQTPDSGTAGRWAQQNVLGLGIGAAGVIPQISAQAITDAYTRQSRIAPNYIKQLLLGAAQASPALAPASVNALRD